MKDSSKEWTPDQEETSAWTFGLLKSQQFPFEFKEIVQHIAENSRGSPA